MHTTLCLVRAIPPSPPFQELVPYVLGTLIDYGKASLKGGYIYG